MDTHPTYTLHNSKPQKDVGRQFTIDDSLCHLYTPEEKETRRLDYERLQAERQADQERMRLSALRANPNDPSYRFQ